MKRLGITMAVAGMLLLPSLSGAIHAQTVDDTSVQIADLKQALITLITELIQTLQAELDQVNQSVSQVNTNVAQIQTQVQSIAAQASQPAPATLSAAVPQAPAVVVKFQPKDHTHPNLTIPDIFPFGIIPSGSITIPVGDRIGFIPLIEGTNTGYPTIRFTTNDPDGFDRFNGYQIGITSATTTDQTFQISASGGSGLIELETETPGTYTYTLGAADGSWSSSYDLTIQ